MPTTPCHRERTRSDAGFTLPEMLVVMIIIAILMAIAVPSFLGAKGSARLKEGATYAATYQRAVASYMADNGNRVPVGAAQMPADGSGPRNLLNKPYMREGIPDGVKKTTVQFCNGACGASATAFTQIRYLPNANQISYAIEVWGRKKLANPMTAYCALGNDASNSMVTSKPC